MTQPTIGQLALRAKLVDARRLEELLHSQQEKRRKGDLRRLGELLAHRSVRRADVRRLLAQQGIVIARCELCATRYDTIRFQWGRPCFRCGQRLIVTGEDEPLSVEDAVTDPGPEGDRLLLAHVGRCLRLGPYTILGEVGRGAQGIIYKAWEPEARHYVALKLLLSPGGFHEDLTRFRREAAAIIRLSHEHIVRGIALADAGGLPYMVMDFVPGVPMNVLASREAISGPRIVEVGVRIASALHHAHGQGLIHRDVKPGNIVIDRHGKPYLVDFGVAKGSEESVSLTAEGEAMGTLTYMAPEYVQHGVTALTEQADVYGLGIVLYQALSGRLPTGDVEGHEMLLAKVQRDPIPLHEVCEVPRALGEVVDRAVARQPGSRYSSAAELGDALEACLRDAGEGFGEVT